MLFEKTYNKKNLNLLYTILNYLHLEHLLILTLTPCTEFTYVFDRRITYATFIIVYT